MVGLNNLGLEEKICSFFIFPDLNRYRYILGEGSWYCLSASSFSCCLIQLHECSKAGLVADMKMN